MHFRSNVVLTLGIDLCLQWSAATAHSDCADHWKSVDVQCTRIKNLAVAPRLVIISLAAIRYFYPQAFCETPLPIALTVAMDLDATQIPACIQRRARYHVPCQTDSQQWFAPMFSLRR
jgi:hypothetical protein